MSDNSTLIEVDGRQIRTLRDILPVELGLQLLFVAKTPAPISVEAGHYFQGAQGRMFWNRLKEYGILKTTTVYEDDSLLDHRFGLTDIVKVPRGYGNEPSPVEYEAGKHRILELIRIHAPAVVAFVYKRVLDEMLKRCFGVRTKSVCGFNPSFEHHLGTRCSRFLSLERPARASKPPSR